MNLTDSKYDAMYWVQWQNPLSSFAPRVSRRPHALSSVFFYDTFPYGRDVQATSVGRFLDTVVQTCIVPITRICTLVSGLTQIKENNMTNPSEDPIRDAIFDLEIIEYDLRRAVQAVFNLTSVHDNIPDDIHYLLDRIWDHSEAVTEKYNTLIDAWRKQR